MDLPFWYRQPITEMYSQDGADNGRVLVICSGSPQVPNYNLTVQLQKNVIVAGPVQ